MSDKFTLTVALEGAAFTDNREAELSRILISVARAVNAYPSGPVKVFDTNGNACGSCEVAPDPVAAAAHDNGAGVGPWVMHGNTTAEQARAIIRARLRRRRPGVDAAVVVPRHKSAVNPFVVGSEMTTNRTTTMANTKRQSSLWLPVLGSFYLHTRFLPPVRSRGVSAGLMMF